MQIEPRVELPTDLRSPSRRRLRRSLHWLALGLVLGLAQCEFHSTDCNDAAFCNPAWLSIAYAGSLVGVGSDLDTCRTYRQDLPATIVSSGQFTVNGCKFLGGVEYGAGRYVAVGSDQLGDGPTTQCVILNSPNGYDWSPVDCGPTAGSGLSPVAYGSGTFVASSTGNLAAVLRVSTDDGVTWQARAAGTTQGIENFLFHNGVFYAASKDGVYASTDPVNVAFATTGSGTEQYEQMAVGADGRIVAIGNSGATPIVKVLQNGVWTTGSGIFANATGGELPGGVIFDGTRFIAIGSKSSGSGADCFADFSYDGLTWNGGYTMHPACAQSTLNWQQISLVQLGLETIVTGFIFNTTATVSELRTISVESGQWSHKFDPNTLIVGDLMPAR
ncbi:MAG: hypothetical protein NXI24_24285 [bacterium]|nr:hypothetical protein [bacterium]